MPVRALVIDSDEARRQPLVTVLRVRGLSPLEATSAAEANAVEPGKRPLSSMSPTIVLKDGKPVMTVVRSTSPSIRVRRRSRSFLSATLRAKTPQRSRWDSTRIS